MSLDNFIDKYVVDNSTTCFPTIIPITLSNNIVVIKRADITVRTILVFKDRFLSIFSLYESFACILLINHFPVQNTRVSLSVVLFHFFTYSVLLLAVLYYTLKARLITSFIDHRNTLCFVALLQDFFPVQLYHFFNNNLFFQ